MHNSIVHAYIGRTCFYRYL